mgnify:FL=1
MQQAASGNAERRERWDKRYASKELVWSAGPNETFAREVAGLQPGRALDVACGEGRNALWLAERGWRVTAVDFSPVAIDKARRIGAHRGVEVEWLAADVSACQFDAEGYDLVAVLFLHTDPEERSRWLQAVLKSLKPGGPFIYIGHDPSTIEAGVGGPQDPLFLPSADALCAALEGFDVITAEVIERPVASDPGHGGEPDGIALDTLVRAVKR